MLLKQMNYLSLTKKLSSIEPYLVREREGSEEKNRKSEGNGRANTFVI